MRLRLLAVKPKPGREANAQALGELPADGGGNVLGCVAQGQREGIAKAAVGFNTGDEFFSAEGALTAALPLRARDGLHRWRSQIPRGSDSMSFSAMKFSEMFQFLRLEERMSFSSGSC